MLATEASLYPAEVVHEQHVAQPSLESTLRLEETVEQGLQQGDRIEEGGGTRSVGVMSGSQQRP
jgi:hypothetical protein